MQLVLQYAIDACFVVDIAMHFRTTLYGRPEEGSVIISDTRIIAQRYAQFPYLHRGFFLHDLLACLPLDLIGMGFAGGLLGGSAHWLRVNRLLHGLRIVSVHGGQITRMSRIRKIGVYGLLWIFQAHLMACIWWGIGTRRASPWPSPSGDAASCRSRPSSRPAARSLACSPCLVAPLLRSRPPPPPFVAPPHPHPPSPPGVADFNFAAARRWASRRGRCGSPPTASARRSRSTTASASSTGALYWAITTLVKVPWIKPKTIPELIFASFVVLSGTFTFSVIIGQITMLQKTYDMARQARSDRLARMRLFCNTRNVAPELKHEALHWTVADQEFSSMFVGRQNIYKLPAAMKNRILQHMYKQVLETFLLARGHDRRGHQRPPHTLLAARPLARDGPHHARLHLEHALRAAQGLPPHRAPQEGRQAGRGDADALGAHLDVTHPRPQGRRPRIKSTKKFQSFCVLERPGSSVGIADIDRPNVLYPFEVDCPALTKVFCISADGLRGAMGEMDRWDRDKCKQVLKDAHKGHVAALKFDEKDLRVLHTREEQLRRLAKRAGKTDEEVEEMSRTGEGVESLLATTTDCYSALKETLSLTSQIKTLVGSLGGETMASPGRTSPTTVGRGGKFGGAERAAVKAAVRGGGGGGDYDELEERTGYAKANEQRYRSAAAAARTIS